jgi:hypothetical protein
MHKSIVQAELDFTNMFSKLRRVVKNDNKLIATVTSLKSRKRPNSMYILK